MSSSAGRANDLLDVIRARKRHDAVRALHLLGPSPAVLGARFRGYPAHCRRMLRFVLRPGPT